MSCLQEYKEVCFKLKSSENVAFNRSSSSSGNNQFLPKTEFPAGTEAFITLTATNCKRFQYIFDSNERYSSADLVYATDCTDGLGLSQMSATVIFVSFSKVAHTLSSRTCSLCLAPVLLSEYCLFVFSYPCQRLG